MNEDFINPIDPDKVSENPGTLAYPHHAGSALVKPEDQGKIKGRALSAMEHQTDMQLGQIYEQMQLLAEQAKKLNDRKQISEFIYTAEMRFEPLINQISLSLIEHDIERNIATHLGASTGRITFELTKMFEEVLYLIKKRKKENFLLFY